jgi:hypothetical protein
MAEPSSKQSSSIAHLFSTNKKYVELLLRDRLEVHADQLIPVRIIRERISGACIATSAQFKEYVKRAAIHCSVRPCKRKQVLLGWIKIRSVEFARIVDTFDCYDVSAIGPDPVSLQDAKPELGWRRRRCAVFAGWRSVLGEGHPRVGDD